MLPNDAQVVSVDDHVVEHPRVWADRLPAKFLDVGPKTRELYARRLRDAGTIVWNGPPGVFEIPEFAAGTRALGEAIASTAAYSLVGGGDTAAAVEQLGLGPFSHVSTGGGATLEYMEGKELPGVAVLKDEK